MSEEQKVKVSKARRAAYAVPGYINPNVGQKREGEALANLHKAYEKRVLPKGDKWQKVHAEQFMPEVRAKMRQKRLGKKPANTKKVLCLETNRVFNGLSEAAQSLNVNRQSIYFQIKGKLKKVAGKYTFKYVE